MPASPFPIARTAGGDDVLFRPALANRHGLITGATGTGKTVTLQVLTDRFSALGVPVFLADVKGDLSGVAAAGEATPALQERLSRIGIAPPRFAANPVVFWDLFARRGVPLRATVSDMGPLLLARLFNLNPTQQGVLALVFRIADERGWLLLDLKDLRAMLQYVANNAKEFRTAYGNVTTTSVGAIQRALLELEQQGGDAFFGEPMLNVDDLLQADASGRGRVHVLLAEELIRAPKVYATFLLWLMSELFEQLPEIGDRDKPTLVFFFDEAHLLFTDAPAALVEKIEQVVRLIRSKGVGVYFVTQNPADVPETVLGQLGNRVQHALRAFTPKDQKAVRVAAETLRANPMLDTAKAIGELAVGEALVSVLDEHGTPTMAQRAWIYPPASRIGPITDAERKAVRDANRAFYGPYEQTIDRESAYEKLMGRTVARTVDPAPADADAPQALPAPPPKTKAEPRVGGASSPAPPRSEPWTETIPGAPAGAGAGPSLTGALSDFLFGRTGPRGGHYDGAIEAAGKSVARSMGSGIGRAIVRGVLGSVLRGR